MSLGADYDPKNDKNLFVKHKTPDPRHRARIRHREAAATIQQEGTLESMYLGTLSLGNWAIDTAGRAVGRAIERFRTPRVGLAAGELVILEQVQIARVYDFDTERMQRRSQDTLPEINAEYVIQSAENDN